jgi:hypothetical protein
MNAIARWRPASWVARADRLLQIFPDPAPEGLHGDVLRAEAGHEDHGERGVGLTKGAENHELGDIWKEVVQQDQIQGLLSDQFEGVQPGAGRECLVRREQGGAQRLQDAGVVVHDQDASRSRHATPLDLERALYEKTR